MNRSAHVAFACLCSCLFWAGGAGRVETREAKVYRGEVRFDDGVVVVTSAEPANAPPQRIPLRDVRSVAVREFAPEKLTVSAGGTLPSPWMSTDVGKVGEAGDAAVSADGVLTLQASGWGVWSGRDSMHWAHRSLAGDGQVIARVVPGKVASRPKASVAVMIRQDRSPESTMAAAEFTATGKVVLNRRVAGRPSVRGPEVDAEGDAWLRLARQGKVVTLYTSMDGVSWRRRDSCELAMTPDALAGIGAWGAGNSTRGVGIVDSVLFVDGTAGTASSLTETGGTLADGVILRDGGIRPGVVLGIQGDSILFRQGEQAETLPQADVARLLNGVVTPIPDSLVGRTGVLMVDGDFLEGEVASAEISRPKNSAELAGRVTVNSLVLGPSEVDARQIRAVLFRDVAPSTARYAVRSADGTLRFAESIEIGARGVSVGEVLVEDVTSIEDRMDLRSR